MLSNHNLPSISKEQYEIVQYLQKTSSSHVHVQAVAGCGKTTTNLYVAALNPNDHILLLTYNSSLKIDTNKKIKSLNIKNIEVHTYHSFGYSYYKNCINDIALFEIVDSGLVPKKKYKFTIVIFDEMQDITILYLQFAKKILEDNLCKNPRLCLLGDIHQTIYQYNGSDERFFKYFPHTFDCRAKYDWKHCILNTTFRCTDQIAKFLNEVMLNDEKRIVTNKKGEPIRYIQCDIFSMRVFDEINYYLGLGYKYDDIFILAPSVKSKSSPVIKLANMCSENNIPIYVSSSDDDKPNEKVLSNKITFLTFHQSKGLERKVIIIMGFDSSYFLFFKRQVNLSKCVTCPNELYVAVTRVLERLTCIHDIHFDYLPFLNVGKLLDSNFVSVERKDLKIKNFEFIEKDASNGLNQSISVSNVLKHVSFQKIIYTYKKCKVKEICPIGEIIEIPTTCLQKNEFYENVSDISALAIISFFQLRKIGKILVRPFLNRPVSIGEMCQICTEVICSSTKFYYKLYQIENYNWITEEQLEMCMYRLNTLNISCNAIFEKEIASSCNRIHGRIDCWDTIVDTCVIHRIYEFKCVSTIDFIHILQLALYAYIILKNANQENKYEKYEFYLFNVLDGNLIRIENTLNELEEILMCLLMDRNHFVSTYFTDSHIHEILKTTFTK